MPNKALQPTWQGAAKNCLNAFLCLSVKYFLEEASPHAAERQAVGRQETTLYVENYARWSR